MCYHISVPPPTGGAVKRENGEGIMKDCFDKCLDTRLASIEGHIRGIRQMVKEQKDCADILLQLSAVEAAIKKASRELLKNHIEHCVKDGVEAGDMSVIDRLEEVLDKYK